jgi:uncharacterized Fe-S cluster-containing protein
MKQKADNLPKIQHYVPQFILRNFCFKNEHLYVFDKKTENVFPTHTKNVAAENGFYNFQIEDSEFTIDPNFTDLETNAAGVFEKIIKQESLSNITKDEKLELSIFVSAQFTRTKHLRIIAEQLSNTLVLQIEKMGINPKNVIGLNANKEEEFIKDVILFTADSVLENAPVFNSREWVLFKSTEVENYYISDNPITLHNTINQKMKGNLGLAVKGIEVYFPISPKLSIGIFDRANTETVRENYRVIKNMDEEKRKGYRIDDKTIQAIQDLIQGLEYGVAVQAKNEEVLFQNSLQVVFSTRFIYSINQDFSLVKELLKNNPEYKEPPQIYGNRIN